ncbi:MAG: NYN domain-containing protein [Candidatus Omnitrophica bacterium]|nr:NYN domain-containing protein [Candidatus Omnitrophota bacterium]
MGHNLTHPRGTASGKTYLLDGYNVIYAIPELRHKLQLKAEFARKALLDECVRYQMSRGDIRHIYVIFDGQEEHETGPQHYAGSVSEIYTRHKEEADERIIRMIRNEEISGELMIVSNDRYVFNRSRSLCASVMSSFDFSQELKKKETVRKKPGFCRPEKEIHSQTAKNITEEYKSLLKQTWRSLQDGKE